ncbi:cbb3-type cytochrome oxidase assembly protein CcoS [Aliifodinibius sp. S!AR15-10]|uniref:cbb3-type cytochrome oxidase assembly protein CcoS n=1 Tax=Aliifodinibius sp. S!AR15-10 TaxID=2950437 RepID=UPI002856E890|nr:cbb3-type cytochrome oxidase assembly protein CcoS [Aliifodinibius sp. S!AR15-10]MDR8393421.1 cbb3-type cytochrome oxidase assembly protein CcoS [Aliifodinibius sp. S!AR15-10]
MEVIFMLIGFSLLVALIFLALFFWAVKSGQFDDQHTPSIRILFDENKPTQKQNSSTTNKKDQD